MWSEHIVRLKQLVYNKSLILIERSLYELLHLLLRGHYSNKDCAYCYERNDGDFTSQVQEERFSSYMEMCL